MDFVKNKYGLYIIIGVLVIVNILTIGFLWINRPDGPAGVILPPPPRLLLEDELSFSSEQIKKFEALRDDHRRNTIKNGEEIRIYKDSLFDNIKTGDDAKAKLYASKISERQYAQELITYEHFKAIRGICDDKQKTKFDSLIKDIVRSMEQQRNHVQNNPPPEDRQRRGQRDDQPPPKQRDK
jgi:periplasmic protein CpxP/Spy